MARLLVQLKLCILRNALRSNFQAKFSFILSTTFAVLLAIGTFVVFVLLRGASSAVDLTTMIFTLFAFGWLMMPIMSFGLDSTLDPSTLALYPLRKRPLAVGLLAASATGAWPAANVLGLLGVMVGLASGALGELVALVAVVLQVLFCITLARLVTTVMARVLRSRRGRDFAAFLFIPIVALYEFLTQVVPRLAASGRINGSSFNGIDAWMRWLPPGMAAHAIQDASDGHIGTALLLLTVVAAVIVVLGVLWIRSLTRALVNVDASTQSAQVRGAALPFARYGLRGAIVARTWIYQRREPTSIIYWGITAVIMAAVCASSIAGKDKHPAIVIASAVFGAAFIGVFHANAIGYSGPAFVTEATALTSRRALAAYFSAQNVVLGAIGVPLLAAMTFLLAALVGHPRYGFVAFAVGLAGLGAALGLSNMFSVTLAYPMVKRVGNPMRAPADGYTSYGVGGAFGNLFGVTVAVIPVIAAGVIFLSTPVVIWAPILIVCSAAYGLGMAWIGVRGAARTAEERLPELCQIATHSLI